MTERELKKLNRAELLELLFVQTKENERLRAKLEKAEAELNDRQLRVQKAGDLAHAVLEINGVMEAAQAAAQQYLDNIARMEKETQQRCRQMLASAGLETLPNDASEPSENVLLDEIYTLLGDEQ